MQPFRQELSFPGGYFPAQRKHQGIRGTVYRGSNAWHRALDGKWVSDTGPSSLGSSGAALSQLQVIDGQWAGTVGLGNIVTAFSTHFFVGTQAYINGVLIGASPGILSLIGAGGTVFPAGLAKPPAPTVSDSGVSSVNTFIGSYAIGVAASRPLTGGLSTVSNPSAVILIKNKKIRVTFGTPVSGQTHWRLYGTQKGLGSLGVTRRISSIADVPIATLFVDIEYFDGQLTDYAPLTNDPPPACVLVGSMGGCVFVITSSGQIFSSYVGAPESYPAKFVTSLAVRETPTGIRAGVSGVTVVSTANSLSAIVLSGSNLIPVIPRIIFGDIGFATANAYCMLFDGQIYGNSGQRGFIRTTNGGDPDSSFALPVMDYAKGLGYTAASTVVVPDPSHDAVLFCSGSTVLPFMRASNTWSTDMVMPGTVTAGVSLNGQAHLQVGSTLYGMDKAGGSPSGGWFIQDAYSDFGQGLGRKKLEECRVATGAGSFTVDMLADQGTTVGGLWPYSHTGPYNSPRKKQTYSFLESGAFKVSGTSGAQEFYAADIRGQYDTWF